MQRLLKMMMLVMLAAILVFAAVGCGAKPEANKETASEPKVAGLTKENPIKFSKEEGSVTILAQVNGKYLYEPTRHGVVFAEGANGEKPILKAFANPEALYNDLIAIGAKAGNNMTFENKETTNVQGDALEVTVTWEGAGKEYNINEVIKDSTGKPINVRFGGNLANAQEYKTGCLICLDSCPVGITSNTTYTYGAVELRKEVGFTGVKDILPADGTLVAVKLTLKK